LTNPSFTIKECLHGYTNDALGTMCEAWRLAAASKPARIRALDKVLHETLHLRSAIRQLDEAAVRLARLIAAHGPADTADLLNVPGLYTRQKPEAALQRLTQLGLALAVPQERAGAFSFAHVTRKYQAGELGPLLFVPEHVQRLLPPGKPLGTAIPVATAPGEVSPNDDRATGIFLETLRIADAVEPRVTSTGEIHTSDETRALELCREVGISDDGFTLALLAARQLGCIEEREGRLKTTPQAERWADQPTPDRVRDLFQAYLAAQDLPDLRLFFPEMSPALEKHLLPSTLRRTYHRTLVARILAEQPEGAWHTIDSLAEAVRLLDRNVLFLDERWRAIGSGAREFSAAWQDRAWQAHEKRLFTWMVGTLFAGLGMVDLADDGALFRVTPVGRYALGVAEAPPDSRNGCEGALVVQPDFEIIAYLDRCPANLRRRLDTFCERRRGGPVSTYLLTQESMYRGVRTGVSATDFLHLIERCASRAIPSNVRQQFLTWERKLDTVIIRERCQIVECRTPEEAEKVAEAHEGSRRIGDRFVLVTGTAPETASRVEYNGMPQRCLREDKGLSLRVPWERCDLFATKTLAEIGELTPEPSGDLVLTLSKGKRKRADWESLLSELEALAETPLPARYRIALRAWGGELEPALSRSVAVLRFSDPEVCQAVLEIPEIAEYLEGRLGDHTVIVKQGKLTPVKKKLKDYGIPVVAGKEVADKPQAPKPAAPNGPSVTVKEVTRDGAKEHARDHGKEEGSDRNGSSSGNGSNGEETIQLPSYSPRIIREIIEDAIARRKPVLIEYEPTYGDRATVRRVNPVALDLAGAQPSLSGYCHLHGGPRAFKLSRINGIRVLEEESF
jgi:hypothetical protein